ncbi:hypothetical protein [Variovorax sp. RA8]|uniref:hypothetical protein n=1 Tax=Variovorax sp. (strain JCM 16519 / RA8) TaxID=662548 RepID=UPI001317209B|nr:hypothetical protein [Variovorax sp. RA8]VTU44042.1 protein TolA [Variovorax sp. RA8]
MTMSVVNRVRFTAWAWLASAFLVGATTGAVAAGVPLWKQLQTAKDDASRLHQVEILTRTVSPGFDVDALVSLEEPPRQASAPEAKQMASQVANEVAKPEPTPVMAQAVASTPVAKVQAAAASAEDVALAANAARAEEAERKAAEARKAAAAADEAERKAKAERQARLEREQKAAKAAQEAQQRKEREQAEAQAASARAKAAAEAQKAREAATQVATPVPAAGTNGPTERVTKDEAGLAEVQASGVTFKSGRRVAVGDTFPSGEKLISIDPRIGEIITSKRRIVIKQ